jgi:hypothetical protein
MHDPVRSSGMGSGPGRSPIRPSTCLEIDGWRVSDVEQVMANVNRAPAVAG